MAIRLINPAPRHFNNSGEVLDSGVLSYFQPLTTTVKRSSSVLSESGLEPDVTLDGPCRVNLVDKNGVQLWSRDNVNDENTPPFALWSGTDTYVLNDLVSTSDGQLYTSTLPENFNNEPTSSPQAWEQVFFVYGDGENINQMAAITPVDSAMLIGTGTGWQSGSLGDLARNYIAGLELSSADDADHDITVEAGRCSDSTNTVSMVIPEITKRIDATWAAGDGIGGRASGLTLEANTWYHLFVVKVGQVVDVIFDTAVTCQNGVDNNGVEYYRRIGSVLTDSAANITPFIQIGDYVYWDSPAYETGTFTGIDPTGQLRTIETPLGVKVRSIMQVWLTVSTNEPPTAPLIYAAVSDPDSPYIKPSSVSYDVVIRTDANTWFQNIASITMTNTSSQVRCEYSDAVTMFIAFRLKIAGWIDPR